LLSAFNKSQASLASERAAFNSAGMEIERLSVESARQRSENQSIQSESERGRAEIESWQAEVESWQAEVERRKTEIECLLARLVESQSAYTDVINSNSWFVTKPVRFLFRLLRNGKGVFRNNLESCKVAVTAYLRQQKLNKPAPLSKSYVVEAPIERVRSVTVVLPVYKGVEMTKRCILAAMPGIISFANSKIIAINDASPDAGMQDMLLELQEQWPGVLTVLENEVNLGFVKTVNRGMRQASQDDIVF